MVGKKGKKFEKGVVVCKCPEAQCIWLRMIIRLVDDCGDDGGGDDDVEVEMDVNEKLFGAYIWCNLTIY